MLSAFQDHALSSEESQRVAAHLEHCENCCAALAQWERDRARFVAAYAAPTEDVDLRDPICAALRAAAPAPSVERPVLLYRWRWAFGGLAAVTLVSLLLLAAIMPGHQSPMIIAPPTQEANGSTAEDKFGSLGYIGCQGDVMNSPAIASDKFSVNELPRTASVMADARFYDDDASNSWALNGNLYRDMGMNANVYELDADGRIISDANMPIAMDATQVIDSRRANRLVAASPSNIKLAYDVNYRLRVKDARQQSLQAQEMIGEHGGFTMNYQYLHAENAPAYASFHGKVPAKNAEAALAAVETLGQVHVLSIAGEDLTEQLQRQQAEIERQQDHAARLDKLAGKTSTKIAVDVEEKRHQAKGSVSQAKRTLLGLNTRHEWITISAEFYEAQPRAAMTLARATQSAHAWRHFAVLLLATLSVALLALGLVAAPIVTLRWLRRRQAV